jgi:hypothetical protein
MPIIVDGTPYQPAVLPVDTSTDTWMMIQDHAQQMFWLKVTASLFLLAVFLLITFWKPHIKPAIKRAIKTIRRKVVAYLKYCEDGYLRNPD